MNYTTKTYKNDSSMKLLKEHANALESLSNTVKGFIDYTDEN